MRRFLLGLNVMAALAAAVPGFAGTDIFVNGTELTGRQVQALMATYRVTAPPPGRYWYDARSGAWGLEGHETVGFLMPGHDFGPLAPNASAGRTGVYINGRELNNVEAVTLQRTFGAVYRGRWWLDGRTGYWGAEGNPVPLGNIKMALRTQQGSSGGGDHSWSSTYARGNSDGNCGYVSVDGATVMTGSCR